MKERTEYFRVSNVALDLCLTRACAWRRSAYDDVCGAEHNESRWVCQHGPIWVIWPSVFIPDMDMFTHTVTGLTSDFSAYQHISTRGINPQVGRNFLLRLRHQSMHTAGQSIILRISQPILFLRRQSAASCQSAPSSATLGPYGGSFSTSCMEWPHDLKTQNLWKSGHGGIHRFFGCSIPSGIWWFIRALIPRYTSQVRQI